MNATTTGSTLDQEILKHTKILQDRLTASQTSTTVPTQDELTKVIQAQLEGMKLNNKDDSPNETDDKNKSNVVYELCGSSSTSKLDTTSEHYFTLELLLLHPSL